MTHEDISGRQPLSRTARAGGVLVVTGVLSLVLGFAGAARSNFLVEDLSFVISGGFGGLLAIVLGAGAIIVAGIRTGRRTIDDCATRIAGNADRVG